MSLPREELASLLPMLGWKEALALVGPRRAGKSTLALMLLDAWREKGGSGEYFDFEEIGAPSSVKELIEATQGIPKKSLLVLDEVQALGGWEKFVRSEVEYERHKLLITGSSATLLSKEIASSLAGRAVPRQVLPLSYRDARAWGVKKLADYEQIGGYPECVLRPQDANTLHKLYFELAILRDVAARKKIRETKPLADLALILLSESGKRISSKKTCEKIGVSQPTFRSFVEGLQDAFLIASVHPFTRSPREKIVSDAKHYAFDTGLQKTISISQSIDEGRRLENVVAIELIRRGFEVSYLSADKECDFIAQAPGKQPLAIQVSAAEELPQREIEGLEAGMKHANAKGLMLTKTPVEQVLPRNAFAKTIEEWLVEQP